MKCMLMQIKERMVKVSNLKGKKVASSFILQYMLPYVYVCIEDNWLPLHNYKLNNEWLVDMIYFYKTINNDNLSKIN